MSGWQAPIGIVEPRGHEPWCHTADGYDPDCNCRTKEKQDILVDVDELRRLYGIESALRKLDAVATWSALGRPEYAAVRAALDEADPAATEPEETPE